MPRYPRNAALEKSMITFSRRSLLEEIKYKIFPSYRKEVDAKTKEAIRFLVSHPEAPCVVEGYLIPHGYGTQQSISETLLGFKL